MKVRIQSGECPSYLTVGKVCEALQVSECAFEVVSDFGIKLYCLFKYCGHINNGSWEVVDE